MILLKSFQYRLRPNRNQARLFSQFAGSCRWVFNDGLSHKIECWEKEQRSISLYDLNKRLTQLKRKNETSWLKDSHSQILQHALEDLDQTYQHFFRRLKKGGEKPGFPKFRSKGNGDSFRYPQGVKMDGNRVFLPKIGFVRFRKSREIEGKLKQTTVIQKGGNWYVSFSCEIDSPVEEVSEYHSIIGIDVGLESFATIASGAQIKEVANPKFLRKELSHLRFLSRQLSNKVKGSQNWKNAKEKLHAFHSKLSSKRKDFLHKLSTQLVKSHDMIVVESLRVKSLLEKSPKYLARAISDAGWRQFLQFLKYKCEHNGKKFLEAGEWFPSTKQCYACGKKNEMGLGDRIYQCCCGFTIHRDHNSALNLRAVGTTVSKACGAAP